MTDTITLRRDGIEATVKVGDKVPMTDGSQFRVVDIQMDDGPDVCLGIYHGKCTLWHSLDGSCYAMRRRPSVDIAKLAEQQRAARPAAVPAEAIRALAERCKARAEMYRLQPGFEAYGQSIAYRQTSADLLRLLGEGDG